MFSLLHSRQWQEGDKATHLLALTRKLTLPISSHRSSDLDALVKEFTINAREVASTTMALTEPLADFSRDWAPWQGLFCLAQPRGYRHAMLAFEKLAFSLWPKLNHTAPHTRDAIAPGGTSQQKIRIGFTVLDAMPMMSGLMERLDKTLFETIFLRPGKAATSKTARDWVARAGKTVEYSDTDAYSAIQTIADEKLDILISGPSVPQIFFPLMARLAHLQIVLLEPNWPDGITNSDYYISWGSAEPQRYREFYKTPVSLLQHPPYWIENLPYGKTLAKHAGEEVRQRLLGLGPEDRFYICPNTPPKIHPDMDELLYKILDLDPGAFVVLLRGDHASARPVKARLRERLGSHYRRVIFLNTLRREDAHALILSADCYLDSYPICGMSSSFDGLMLGVPIVTLPADIPFGKWTAAIYEYIGVSGLTARDTNEYIRIAMTLANDKGWRETKSAEILHKAHRYVESTASFDEFQHFLIQAWHRKQAGLPPASWVAGEWQ
jgi:predicted O-linked N-acetylglucosamine transferase (SPINDLY family)